MALLVWIILIGGVAFMIWYGYGLLARRSTGSAVDLADPIVHCHLCRRELPESEMVTREKTAGYVNYFCGDCIESLYHDHVEGRREKVNLN